MEGGGGIEKAICLTRRIGHSSRVNDQHRAQSKGSHYDLGVTRVHTNHTNAFRRLLILLYWPYHFSQDNQTTAERREHETMMFARGLDWAHQTQGPLRRMSTSRPVGPAKLAVAAASVGTLVVIAGLTRRNVNNSIVRHSTKQRLFADILLSSQLSASEIKCKGDPWSSWDINPEPLFLTLTAESESDVPHKSVRRY